MLKAQPLAWAFALCCLAGPAQAETVNVAAAANFTAAANDIEEAFEAATSHDVVFSFGSTGKLYSLIVNGAPFDAFLAADAVLPERLEGEGHAIAGTRFTYALGTLVLWSPRPGQDLKARLLAGSYERLAIANPKTAPYGAAAAQALEAMGLTQDASDKLVQGDSVAQTQQFVGSGAADLGFVALAQVVLDPSGSTWLVDEGLYDTIAQQAVLLVQGADNAAALAFLKFLKGPRAVEIIRSYGYGTAE